VYTVITPMNAEMAATILVSLICSAVCFSLRFSPLTLIAGGVASAVVKLIAFG
jgi:hypothetical protein